MRNWIIAAALALSAPIVTGASAANAETRVIITDTDRGGPHHDRRFDRDRRHDRDWRHDRRAERRDRGCVTKKVVRIVHGERVSKTTRVCR